MFFVARPCCVWIRDCFCNSAVRLLHISLFFSFPNAVPVEGCAWFIVLGRAVSSTPNFIDFNNAVCTGTGRLIHESDNAFFFFYTLNLKKKQGTKARGVYIYIIHINKTWVKKKRKKKLLRPFDQTYLTWVHSRGLGWRPIKEGDNTPAKELHKRLGNVLWAL